MNHHQSFLQAIIEQPDDDTPRLVYADWLEEHGDPDRAEFIRLQCELAGMAEADPRQREHQARERTLLAAHEREWAGPLDRLVTGYEFRRGFVEAVVSSAAFFRDAGRLFAAAPVRVVRIRWGEATRQDWAGCRHLRRLTGLDLASNGRFDRVNLGHVLASPHLTGLRTLRLAGTKVGTGGVRDLVAWPPLAGLLRLDLVCSGLDDSAAEVLASSLYIGGLGELSLRGNRVGAAGARAAGAIASRGGLTALDLGGNHTLGDAGCGTLAASADLGRLARLSLADAGIGDDGVRALALARCISGVAVLDLAGNAVGDAGCRALAASPHLARLQELSLKDAPVGDEGVRAMLASPHLAGLARLVVSGRLLSGPVRAMVRGRFGAGAVMASRRASRRSEEAKGRSDIPGGRE